MKIRLMEIGEEARWDDYVRNCLLSNAYHQSPWRKVVENTFGHKTYYLFSEDEQQNITGILPLIRMKSILFGSFLVSMPYFNYGGPCSESAEVYRLLVDEAIHLAKIDNLQHVELREDRLVDIGLPFKTAKVSMRLDLPCDATVLWESFSPNLRNKIRRPQREKMLAKIGRVEELESFYEVFSTNMRDLGTPVYPKEFFKNILDAFPDSTWICTVYNGVKPVASGFLIGFKGQLEIPWASAVKKYNASRPNALLYWTVLEFACRGKYKVFDFGRSTPGEGTYIFKQQWGAKPTPLYWFYWMRDGRQIPELNPANQKYKAAIALWKKLPVAITRLIGPFIVRDIP